MEITEEELKAWAKAHAFGPQRMPQAVAVLKLFERLKELEQREKERAQQLLGE